MVEPKSFQDALLAYHARPCDEEAEAVRAAILDDEKLQDLALDLLRGAIDVPDFPVAVRAALGVPSVLLDAQKGGNSDG
jgi:hypothetical protein